MIMIMRAISHPCIQLRQSIPSLTLMPIGIISIRLINIITNMEWRRVIGTNGIMSHGEVEVEVVEVVVEYHHPMPGM